MCKWIKNNSCSNGSFRCVFFGFVACAYALIRTHVCLWFVMLTNNNTLHLDELWNVLLQ